MTRPTELLDLTPAYYKFGAAGDVLQVGDFDGDYVADLAVYRPANGSWWTTVFPFGMHASFGAAGAVPTSSMPRRE